MLIVDGANVVGSRPNGWWRDRAGAARRLHDAMARTDLGYHEVLLVLEGAAKRGRPVGEYGGVRTVHAPGSGDDEIVEVTRERRADGHEVVVVTADRGLRGRVAATGASYVGPNWLWERLS